MEGNSAGVSSMTLEEFNQLDPETRRSQLMQKCQCAAWAERVAARAPFGDRKELLDVAALEWQTADEKEVLDAFAGHPQIGDLGVLKNRYAVTANAEQGQVLNADERTLVALKDANEAYLSRYGFIFIVCASGKSAEEMLVMISDRLKNSRADELVNGAREQAAITELRLKKMIED